MMPGRTRSCTAAARIDHYWRLRARPAPRGRAADLSARAERLLRGAERLR